VLTSDGEVAWLQGPGGALTHVAFVDFSWQIAGIRDIDGDGRSDLVWRQTQTGDVAVWLTEKFGAPPVKPGQIVAAGVPLQWEIVGVGDLDGDRKADLVWRHTQAGDVAVWLMDGVTVKSGPVVSPGVPLEWEIAEVEDFDGDGNADLVWQNTRNGFVDVWQMDGARIKQSIHIQGFITDTAPRWRVQ